MHIFIGNLSGNASLLELQHFLGNHVMNVDYSSHSHDKISKADNHFLLIKTSSNESADRLINEINGKKFHGVAVEARRFIKRNQQKKRGGQERRNTQMGLNLIISERD